MLTHGMRARLAELGIGIGRDVDIPKPTIDDRAGYLGAFLAANCLTGWPGGEFDQRIIELVEHRNEFGKGVEKLVAALRLIAFRANEYADLLERKPGGRNE